MLCIRIKIYPWIISWGWTESNPNPNLLLPIWNLHLHCLGEGAGWGGWLQGAARGAKWGFEVLAWMLREATPLGDRDHYRRAVNYASRSVSEREHLARSDWVVLGRWAVVVMDTWIQPESMHAAWTRAVQQLASSFSGRMFVATHVLRHTSLCCQGWLKVGEVGACKNTALGTKIYSRSRFSQWINSLQVSEPALFRYVLNFKV